MNLDKKALAGFIKEIEDSRDRAKGETEFQRDVFKRAREKHFDVKAMRIVLQRRAMEPSKRDEQDYNVEAYEMALGAKKDAVEAMEQGASAREAAERYNLPRAAVTALKGGTENENFEPTRDAAPQARVDDGAALATAAAPPSVVPCPPTPQVAEVAASAAKPVPEGGVGTGTHPGISQDDADTCRLEVSSPPSDAVNTGEMTCRRNDPSPQADEAPATPAVGAVAASSPRVASSVLTPHVTTDDDDLEIPHFLRRVPA